MENRRAHAAVFFHDSEILFLLLQFPQNLKFDRAL